MRIEVKKQALGKSLILGNLYIIGHLVGKGNKDSFLANFLIPLIKKEYYACSSQAPSQALESSLKQVNLFLDDFSKQGNLCWIGKLHLICACFAKNKIYLSQIGQAKALLIRKGQLIDIAESLPDKKYPAKTFTNIVKGKLESGDKLIFALPGLFNHYSREKLRHLVSSSRFKELKTNQALVLEIIKANKKNPHVSVSRPIQIGNAPIISLEEILKKVQSSKFKVQNCNLKLKTALENIKRYKFPLIASFVLAILIFFLISHNQKPPAAQIAPIEPEPVIAEESIKSVEVKFIADLSIALAPSQIIKIKNGLFFYNPTNNSIYEFDLLESKIKIAGAGSKNIGYFKKATPSGDEIVFYTDTPGLAIFNPKENRLSQTETVFAFPKQNIIDLASYSTSIYLLDLSNNQINKHKKIASGFSIGQAWLKEKIDLSGTISMTIDGSIYILKSDGTASKYLGGKQVEFNLQELTIPLNQPTKIFTNSETKNLYILDPNNNRLVVFNKQGDFIRQYTSPKLSNLKDAWVEEEKGKAYLLNGVEVYEITLTQQ